MDWNPAAAPIAPSKSPAAGPDPKRPSPPWGAPASWRASSSADGAGVPVQLGKGWVGEEALAIAWYSVLVATDFADAVRIAANHDGDSDSTASIAGQIYGAWKGLHEVPHGWIRRLDALDPLAEVAGRMLVAWGGG